eukprot:Gregarina_sp_Poly_1__5655@NODE_2982_length_1483_cov_25_786723_g1883_i0_p1_GENE_NODE_2982_length_1483_cov_25_786723_g1883_i0NODE_2982_length_1483_cov_25_786723_g1883_i0_p1_ORF_typecomplete_len412_score20_50Exo_endo_phos/PF03372_23/2_3e18Exo_endo_phos_2/PF14529_6/6_6Exo_endo_phos_2/PF14529_6/0_71_NODE_2982_length_1483_cov_25_786723_g1883_i01981433
MAGWRLTLPIFMKPLTEYYKKRKLQNPLVGHSCQSPLKILSWNANGLVSRIKTHKELEAFGSLVQRHDPDLICIQEVKLSAHGPPGCAKGDGRPRQRGCLRQDTRQDKQEADAVFLALRCQPFSQYNSYWTLSDWRYAGQLVLLRKGVKPLSVAYNLVEGISKSQHHVDGRVILLEFPDFDFLATYSPNHGWEQSSWSRRDQWDHEVCAFLEGRRRHSSKQLIWMGDLNVAPEDIDLTHPSWFRKQVPRKDTGFLSQSVPAERVGQPGCADAERAGFQRYLKSGNLVDAYRLSNQKGPPKSKNGPPKGRESTEALFDIDAPCWTWRGSPGIQNEEFGRFFGKGMRIDHVLVSAEFSHRVQSVDILGYSRNRIGYFGSDHCPILLTLHLCTGILESGNAPKMAKTTNDPESA